MVFSQQEIDALGSEADNIIATQLWLAESAFVEKYRAKFSAAKNPTNTAFAALGYDAVRLAVESVRYIEAQGVRPTRETIIKAIPNIEFEGYSGHTDFSSGQLSSKHFPLLTVRQGSFQQLYGAGQMRARFDASRYRNENTTIQPQTRK